MLIWLSITFSMGTLQMCHAVFVLGGGDLNHNHFHGYITAEPCQMLVIWISITDFMGTLHISQVRCWWFESQSVIQWVLCRWALSGDGHLNLSQWFSGYFADEPSADSVVTVSHWATEEAAAVSVGARASRKQVHLADVLHLFVLTAVVTGKQTLVLSIGIKQFKVFCIFATMLPW